MSNLSGSNSGSDDLGTTTVYIRPLAGRVSSIVALLIVQKICSSSILILQLRHDEILNHFSAFGDVNNVRIRNKTKRSYGFVKFNVAKSAAKALRANFHIIDGRRVKIAVANDQFQNKTSFTDLNDDCIHTILSMKCLRTKDLCSAAESCHRLKEIASRVFAREHRTYVINRKNTKNALRILMNFGSVITHLKIVQDWDREETWSITVWNAVTKYCSRTLQLLDLLDLDLETYAAKCTLAKFNKLQRLSILGGFFGGISKELFAYCGSLVELKIIARTADFILGITFPKLERFECQTWFGMDSIPTFISRHLNLSSIKIWSEEKSSVMQIIPDCKRLEALAYIINSRETCDFSGLSHLRELDIHCSYRNVMETALGLDNFKFLERLTLQFATVDVKFIRLLTELKRLQVLTLAWCDVVEDRNKIGDLNQLTTLKIHCDTKFDLDIVLLVKRLSNLNYLTIGVEAFKLELETYLRLVNVVRQRSVRSKLTFRLIRYKFNYKHLRNDFSRNAHIIDMNVSNYDHGLCLCRLCQ